MTTETKPYSERRLTVEIVLSGNLVRNSSFVLEKGIVAQRTFINLRQQTRVIEVNLGITIMEI